MNSRQNAAGRSADDPQCRQCAQKFLQKVYQVGLATLRESVACCAVAAMV